MSIIDTIDNQIIIYAIIASYRVVKKKHFKKDINKLKKKIVEKAMLYILHPKHFKTDSDLLLDNLMSYGQYLIHTGKAFVNGPRATKKLLELAFEDIKELLCEIHPYSEDDEKTAFVSQTYRDVNIEYSNETNYSYKYFYCIPHMLQLNNGLEIGLKDDVLKNNSDLKEITKGVTISYADSRSWKERERCYEIHISEDICPVRIHYSKGEGSGYDDSGYFDSKQSKHCVTYLKDIPQLREILKK